MMFPAQGKSYDFDIDILSKLSKLGTWQLCAFSISKSLFILFKHSLENECFPNQWKKANTMSIHKKRDKQFTQNYRPISLLPICRKIFEKLIFNSLFIYLENNNVVNPHQSGFRPVDSYDIYESLDASPSLKVRGIFLDLAKAFDRVSHESLLFKLKHLGLSGKYYSFFRNRPQKTVQWSSIKTEAHQGSILRTVLF